jgi:antitoxin CptB
MIETMTEGSLEHRRKRAFYRATHRGTKELDWLIGRYAEVRLPELAGPSMDLFEKFLTIQDPELHAWIMTPERLDQPIFEGIVNEIRTFHGLT